MATQDIIRAQFEAFNRHDSAAFAACYAAKAVVTDPQFTEPLQSPEAITNDIGEWFGAFPDIAARITCTVVDGATYAVAWSMSGTHNGPLLMPDGHVPATGKPIRIAVATIGRLDFHPIGFALDLDDVTLVQLANPDPPVAHMARLRARLYPPLAEIANAWRERLGQVFKHFPILGERMDQPAGTLSGGEQQMLAIGKALLLDPEILLLDELSLGLAPVVVQEILATVERLKAQGMTMVIVEQSVNVALSVADRAVFMEKGQVRFQGPAAELRERDDLVRAVFLGGEGG